MALETCIYKTVTLAAGETFNLPAGAELVFVDGTVTSDCADIPETTLVCYDFNMPVAGFSFTSSEQHLITAIIINDTRIELDSTYGTNGTDTGGVGFESGADFTERLANNIWNQLAFVTNGALVVGLGVELIDDSQDTVNIKLAVPNSFTILKIEVIDKESEVGGISPTYYVNGVLNEECTPLVGVEFSYYTGSLD